ncbi:MAG: hypothetical protein N2037_14595 [Acidimicrobiales bacterium]|nr:hypothetical protein [Acidimicrobiales bacterium]
MKGRQGQTAGMPPSTFLGMTWRKLRRVARKRAVEPFDGQTRDEPIAQAMLAEIAEMLVGEAHRDTRVRAAFDELAAADAALRGWDVERERQEQVVKLTEQSPITGTDQSGTAVQTSRTVAALAHRGLATANQALAEARRRREEAIRTLEHAQASLARDVTSLAKVCIAKVNRYVATLNAERARHGMGSIELFDDVIVEELVRSALQPLSIDPSVIASFVFKGSQHVE